MLFSSPCVKLFYKTIVAKRSQDEKKKTDWKDLYRRSMCPLSSDRWGVGRPLLAKFVCCSNEKIFFHSIFLKYSKKGFREAATPRWWWIGFNGIYWGDFVLWEWVVMFRPTFFFLLNFLSGLCVSLKHCGDFVFTIAILNSGSTFHNKGSSALSWRNREPHLHVLPLFLSPTYVLTLTQYWGQGSINWLSAIQSWHGLYP